MRSKLGDLRGRPAASCLRVADALSFRYSEVASSRSFSALSVAFSVFSWLLSCSSLPTRSVSAARSFMHLVQRGLRLRECGRCE